MRRRFSCFMAFGLILALGGVVQAQITNGSFETGTSPGSTFTTLYAGDSTTITGWTVNTGSVDYIGGYWNASDGSRSLDMDGLTPASISTTLSTVAGQTYEVLFDIAGNSDGPPLIKSLNVSVDSAGSVLQQQQYSYTLAGHPAIPNLVWQQMSYLFQATGTSTVLTFASADPSTELGSLPAYGAALDNVRVNAVPEPASVVMCGLAAVMISGVAFRRGRKAESL